MNFLKIKLGVFSLLAVLAVSVFLTSCEQDVMINTPETELSQEELLSTLNTDSDFILLMELTTERRQVLITNIKENNVDISTIQELHLSEKYDGIYHLLGLDMEDFENQNEQIQELSIKLTEKYPSLMQECTTCTESIEQNVEFQYEALQTVLDADINMRACWSWRYAACAVGCQFTPLPWMCEFICHVKYCM